MGRVASSVVAVAWLAAAAVLLPACTTSPVNPSFPVSMEAAKADLDRMHDEPREPERPIVVISGLYDPGFAADRLEAKLRAMLSERSPVMTVTPFTTLTMEACRQRVVEHVQMQFPSADDAETVEVDVIGFSLGGVIARDAAIAREGERRLKIKRLFTISSPHVGASAAGPAPDERVRSLRNGSEFLSSIDLGEFERGYPIYAYVRLDDRIVGTANAGPRDEGVWWVSNRPLELAHGSAYRDPRILADIGRRLRGEEPLTTWPPCAAAGK